MLNVVDASPTFTIRENRELYSTEGLNSSRFDTNRSVFGAFDGAGIGKGLVGQTHPIYTGIAGLIKSRWMYLKCHRRNKNGKLHRYWSIVESYRLANGRSAKRQVLYLGEINDFEKANWCRFIEAFDSSEKPLKQVALCPTDRCAPPQIVPEMESLHLNLGKMAFHRSRQWGACWLTLKLWELLGFDAFFGDRLKPSRKGTPWLKILTLLLCNRFIAPGSEWFVHRHWYRQTALSDMLGLDREVVQKNALYDCHDQLLEHKSHLFTHLRQRWKNLFNAEFEVLAYSV